MSVSSDQRTNLPRWERVITSPVNCCLLCGPGFSSTSPEASSLIVDNHSGDAQDWHTKKKRCKAPWREQDLTLGLTIGLLIEKIVFRLIFLIGRSLWKSFKLHCTQTNIRTYKPKEDHLCVICVFTYEPPQQRHIQTISLKPELFVLLPAISSASAAPKLPQVRELLVWLPLKSGTTYLTLYDQATPLRHKITWKLICLIRHLPPD